MSKVNTLVLKYKRSDEKYKGGIPKFNPTVKWVEYSLDLVEAKRLLQDADFTSKFELMKVITAIESKVKYHENHAGFNLQKAISEFRLAKRLLRL
jgi:hypothetical protein